MVDRRDRKRATRSDRLDLVFGALSDPTRRKMLKTLSRGDACVSDLAIGHPISLQAASKHVQVLERAGLVRRRREGRNSYLELRAPRIADPVCAGVQRVACRVNLRDTARAFRDEQYDLCVPIDSPALHVPLARLARRCRLAPGP